FQYKLPYRIRGRLLHYKFSRLNLKDYDIYILHGGKSLELARRHHPNLWYCHSPTIWLYDLYEEELRRFNFLNRQLFRVSCHFLRKRDKKNVSYVDKIVTNSKNVKDRVRRIYGRDADVVYPPVNLKKFKYNKTGDFYLSTARLTPDKRVDVIVRAFQKMPNKKLVVCSGGTELSKIQQLAEGYKNIDVLGWISEDKLRELYGNCIATVFASLYEDLGMVALESMAAGKPVIASGDKGFKETVIDKKTGLLINPTVENIIKAVEWMTPERARKMRKACEERARDFSEDKFVDGIKKAIEEVLM
ncbi:MAG TPA: glycosyltransferase, partial [Thermoprotei archaeon]|nr:glycosyltransferase [Thermoprotei archaeon]